MRVTISVPATAANLGPGFDCFGLALELCNDAVIDTDAAPGVTWEGEGADELPTDGSDLLTSSMRRAAGDRVLPPAALLGRNRVPLARGLGSSSAAVVAGVVAAAVLLGDDPAPARVFPTAAAIEGHPDNAAPACLGGFTIATPDGFVRRLDPHPDLRPTAIVPTTVRLATDHARAALPPSVPREDAVANVAAAALAVEAITRAPELLERALRDRLHQEARLALVPPVRAAFDAVRDAGVPVCVAGAGPSLLAFPDAAHGLPDLGEGLLAMPLAPRAAGFVVEVDRA
jgi:homoserine kinase